MFDILGGVGDVDGLVFGFVGVERMVVIIGLVFLLGDLV